MADKIQYDPTKHAELKNIMIEVQTNFDELTAAYKNVKSVVSSDFKGDASTALQSALEQKITQLTKEKEDWSIVIDNAGQVGKAFVESDRNAKRVMQGQEPYSQGKGGKIY